MEAESHSIRNKINQPHLMTERVSQSWQWSVQQQKSGRADLSAMSSHPICQNQSQKVWTVVLNSVITWCQNLEHWDSTVFLTLIILLQPEMCGEFLIYAHFIFTIGNTINFILPVLLPLSWPEESVLLSPVWLHVLSPAQLPDSVSWSRNSIISDH